MIQYVFLCVWITSSLCTRVCVSMCLDRVLSLHTCVCVSVSGLCPLCTSHVCISVCLDHAVSVHHVCVFLRVWIMSSLCTRVCVSACLDRVLSVHTCHLQCVVHHILLICTLLWDVGLLKGWVSPTFTLASNCL